MEVDITEKVKKILKFGPVALVVLAVLCAGAVWAYQHQQTGLTVYDAQTASTMVSVKAKADGKITELVVEEGDHVAAGDVIAHVQASVTDEQIAQLEQNAALAKQNLAQVQKGQTITVPGTSAPAPASAAASGNSQAVANARARLNRMNELFEMGAVSAVQRDQAAADLAAAEADAAPAPVASAPAAAPRTITKAPDPAMVQQAELAVKQAEAALENAKQDAQMTDIVAPVDGTVYFVDGVQEGMDIRAGQAIANIGDDADIWVEAKLSPAQKDSIRLGQFVSYTIDGKKYQGTVVDIKDPSDVEETAAPTPMPAPEAAQDTPSQDAIAQNAADASTEQTADAQPKTTVTATEGSDESVGDDRLTVKISLPKDEAAMLRPGMEAVVKFALNK